MLIELSFLVFVVFSEFKGEQFFLENNLEKLENQLAELEEEFNLNKEPESSETSGERKSCLCW